MEITGKIIAALEPRKGTSARTGSPWMTQDYVLETHDQYPRKLCFNVFGEEKIKQFNIQVGEELTVSFDIDAHEYQGRWFNSIRAWAVNRNVQQTAQPAQPVGAPAVQNDPFGSDNGKASDSQSTDFGGGSVESGDDLPF